MCWVVYKSWFLLCKLKILLKQLEDLFLHVQIETFLFQLIYYWTIYVIQGWSKFRSVGPFGGLVSQHHIKHHGYLLSMNIRVVGFFFSLSNLEDKKTGRCFTILISLLKNQVGKYTLFLCS